MFLRMLSICVTKVMFRWITYVQQSMVHDMNTMLKHIIKDVSKCASV